VVRRSNGLTARQLVNLTGFDRYAIYAAAKRLKKTLPSPYQK
jgi:predicted DNA-binding transcriptional regulator AlpA